MNKDVEQLDIVEILNVLPHRYPLLLVDRVKELILGDRILCLKNVTMNEQFFQGHFPGRPVMPGVLIIESLAQAGAILGYLTEKEKVEGKLVYFAGIDGVKFRRPVEPGDQLLLDVKIIKRRKRFLKFEAFARVGEEIAVQAQLLATFG
jgi:3-hydroxyacyl-[acyl-carrier-protein] dehydratase